MNALWWLAGLVVVLLAAGCGGSPASVTFAQPGVITDLGSLDGVDGQSVGRFVNNSGEVIGSSAPPLTSPYTRPFRWTLEGGLEDISDAITVPYGLSETGDVVGEHEGLVPYEPFPVLLRGREPIRLGDRFGFARAVNDLGQVVCCEPIPAKSRGRCWTWDDGTIEMLPDSVHATAINNRGEIVGVLEDDWRTDDRGIRLGGDAIRRIPTFGGNQSYPADIDEEGRVVGGADRADETVHAFHQGADGSMHDLGTLYAYSEARALNERGVVVGTTDRADGGYHAFVFHASIGMRALDDFLPPDSGWQLVEANDVNDSNQIVGLGVRGGSWRGFMLDLSGP